MLSSVCNATDVYGDLPRWARCLNSTAEVCSFLEALFVDEGCDQHRDTDLCVNLKTTFQGACDVSHAGFAQESLVYVMYFVTLLLCLLVGQFIITRQLHAIPESGAWVTIGLGMGLLMRHLLPEDEQDTLAFSSPAFFLLLLPPIVFNAGLEINKRDLRRNAATIMNLAVFGTLVAAVVCGVVVYYLGPVVATDSLPLVESLLFGTLISSIDPVAVLNVFNSIGVDPLVSILVSGEALLNDAVVLVTFEALEGYLNTTLSWAALGPMLAEFSKVALLSALLGVSGGITSSLTFKHIQFENAKMEVLVFISFALITYYICEAAHLSGIAALVFESVFMGVFTLRNMSADAQSNIKFTISSVGYLCEIAVFAYVGLAVGSQCTQFQWDSPMVLVTCVAVLASRAASVYVVCWATNRLRTESIPLNMQHMLWFSGLRGAVSLALAVNVPAYNAVLDEGTTHSNMIITCTVCVILLEVFVFGGLCPFVLRWLKVPIRSQLDRKDLVSAINEGVAGEPDQEFFGLHGWVSRLVRTDRLSAASVRTLSRKGSRLDNAKLSHLHAKQHYSSFHGDPSPLHHSAAAVYGGCGVPGAGAGEGEDDEPALLPPSPLMLPSAYEDRPCASSPVVRGSAGSAGSGGR